MTAFCLGRTYQGRLRSGIVRPSSVETDRSAEMSEDLAESGRISGDMAGACPYPSRRGADAEAETDFAGRVRTAASVLGVTGEALTSLLDGGDLMKKEEFFPALDDVVDAKLGQVKREEEMRRREDREAERVEREGEETPAGDDGDGVDEEPAGEEPSSGELPCQARAPGRQGRCGRLP